MSSINIKELLFNDEGNKRVYDNNFKGIVAILINLRKAVIVLFPFTLIFSTEKSGRYELF